MNVFFFNDCIPVHDNLASFSLKLKDIIQKFGKLLDENIDISRGVVTHAESSLCYYGNSFNLKQAIDSINDKSSRDLAYSLFLRFPIGTPNFDDSGDDLLLNSYQCSVGIQKFDAINLAIVEKNGGYLFTPAVDEKLSEDEIHFIVNQTEEKKNLPNFFGGDKNYDNIFKLISSRNLSKLKKFDKLISSLDARYSKQFKKDFDGLSEISQQQIIDHFEDARARLGIFSLYSSDGQLIKDVTPSKPKCQVSELRIFKERAMRIYFNETNERIYLGSIGLKNNNQQDQDIKQAHNILYKLILTS